MAVDWGYYDKFDKLSDKYLPVRGEGETKATQIVTAVNKLVYKWYNDGDVFDNTYHLEGWWNDLSSYANWLYKHTNVEVQNILDKISSCLWNEEYEDLLKELTDTLFNEEYLLIQNKLEKECSIYTCEGKFKFEELQDDDEDDYYDEDWYEDEDTEEDEY